MKVKNVTNAARNAELVRIARRIAAEHRALGQKLTLRELAELVVLHQPSHHYVEYNTAMSKMRMILKKGIMPYGERSLVGDKWKEISQQVQAAMLQRRRLGIWQALTFVLCFKRPSRFYISPACAKKILSPHFYSNIAAR